MFSSASSITRKLSIALLIALLGSVQVPVASADTPAPEDGLYDCATGVKRADSDWTGFHIASGNVYDINCTGTVVLPDGLTSIGSSAFYNSALTSITIPSSVTSIGDRAFEYAQALASIDIPSSVQSIGESAFYGAKSLTSIIIPEGVTSIANSTFAGASSLASVTIPSSVTSIGDSAFKYTTSLTSITIPSSVTSILARAFYGASSLTSITIPAGVTSIGSNVFDGTASLTDISVETGNPNYTSIDGVLFTKSEETLMRYPAGKTATSYTIPSTVKKLGKSSFAGVTNLTSITMPEGLTSIDENVFYKATALTSVNIPEGVRYIGESAFDQATALTSVTIPSTVTSIGAYAFYYTTSLISITIPSSVKTIEEGAFYGAASLTDIYFLGNASDYVGDYAFGEITTGAKAHITATATGFGTEATWNGLVLERATVPNGVPEDGYYACATGVKLAEIQGRRYSISNGAVHNTNCSGAVVLPEGVSSIEEQGFYFAELTSINIPSSVTSIGEYAFAYTTLSSITIQEGLTSIGNYAFSDSALTSINIPATVTSIGVFAFSSTPMTSVTIQEGVTSIGPQVFQYSALTSIDIPSTVTSIGRQAFAFTALTTVTIPAGVTSIGAGVFKGVTTLTSISVAPDNQNYTSPDGVLYDKNETALVQYPAGKSGSNYNIRNTTTSIGESAFNRAVTLTSVTIPAGLTSISAYAFDSATLLKDLSFLGDAPSSVGFAPFDNITSDAKAHITATATGFGTEDTWNGLVVERAAVPNGVPEDGYYACATGIKLESNSGVRYQISNGAANSINCSGAVVLADGVTSISNFGFDGTQLTSITIPSSVTNIGDYAFYGARLPSITIPSSVISIGASAFQNVEALAHITIPESVTFIGNAAFYSAKSLISVTNLSKVTSIGDRMFAFATALTSVSIPSSVTSIGDGAFSGATSLTSISIPASVTSIGSGAFDEAFSMTSFSVELGNQNYASDNGALLNKNKTTLIAYPASKIGSSYTIPATVNRIEFSAFYGAKSLTSITIPEGVTIIAEMTFAEAESLTSVTIPSSVTYIDYAAFGGATALTSITIPASVTYIEEEAFAGATSLKDVYFLGNAPDYVGDYAFDEIADEAKVHITATATGFGTEATWNGLVVERATTNYAVTYNSALGSSVASGTFTSGGSIQVAPVSTRTGYTLVGWSTTPTGTVVSFPYTPSVTADITLHAIWAAVAVKPSYVSGAKLTGTAKVGKAVAVSKGTWKGTATIAYSYQWYVCKSASTKVLTAGKVAPKCTLIKNAKATSFKPTAKEKAGYLAVLITGTNKTGKSAIFTSTSGKVS